MFAKFDKSGNLESLSIATSFDEIKPTGDGFEAVPAEIAIEDIDFIEKIKGKIVVSQTKKALNKEQKQDYENKLRRSKYLDAYRKYQAAVNYGEFKRVIAVDSFMKKLRDKKWEAFNSIPMELAYFAGECSFTESSLTEIK